MNRVCFVEAGELCLAFSEASAGFPAEIRQKLRGDRQACVVKQNRPWLTATLADGRKARPYLCSAPQPLRRTEEDGTVHLHFENIPWRADNLELQGWDMTMEYTIHPDGVCFFDVSFVGIPEGDQPDIAALTLEIRMDLQEDQYVRWNYWSRPEQMNAVAIQSPMPPARGLTERKPLTAERMILPAVGFDFGQEGRLYRHIEWLAEDQQSLDGDPDHTCTELQWLPCGPVLRYEFAASGARAAAYPYYWHNKFAFVLRQTPVTRAKAPFRAYHFLDSFQRYPTPEQICDMADAGANLLILHECWRTDTRLGGTPADAVRFRETIAACHAHGIRVAPYVRGDEETVQDSAADWFKWYLKKDYDGLYLDYGGPVHLFEKGGRYPRGRFAFQRYYRQLQALRRDTIGEHGVMILHTGTSFSALCLGPQLLDGYTAGEGEKGVLLASRAENAYYSAAACAAGALWTAAFPAYKTERMLPYMANIGQFPHVSLGMQIASSSLAHPVEPGNVTFMRPLWRMYELMDGETGIGFSNDLCSDALVCADAQTGLSVFTMRDGSRLYLMSNFARQERVCTAPIAAEPGCLLLRAAADGCSAETVQAGRPLEAVLHGYGICGFLMAAEGEPWQMRLQRFLRPYPPENMRAQAYAGQLEQIRRARFTAEPGRTAWLRVSVPFYNAAYETELWRDLYELDYTLTALDEQGDRHMLGYLSRRGLTQQPAGAENAIWPMQASPWIALHTRLQPGRYRMEICAYRGSEEYYNFYQAELAAAPDSGQTRKLVYRGELDENRSRLTFRLVLTK